MVRSALPFSLTVRARPTVPPAPSRLKTSVPLVILSSSITFAAVRAVMSYPPPAELGTMIRRSDIGLLLSVSPDLPVTPPQAESDETAKASPTAPTTARFRPLTVSVVRRMEGPLFAPGTCRGEHSPLPTTRVTIAFVRRVVVIVVPFTREPGDAILSGWQDAA